MINVEKVTAAVAQAWCTPENENKIMDLTLAQAAIDNVMQLFISEAFDTLKQAMIYDDPKKKGSLAHSWHCNIAMMCHDAILEHDDQVDFSHKVGNDAASRFMKLCFDVETN